MRRILPLRAALWIFVFACLLSSARLVVRSRTPTREAPDAQQRAGQRFAALRQLLPNNGVVGYVGPPESSALGDYYVAQYVLAPLVVDSSINHPLVIGNFPHSQPSQIPSNLTLLRDLGDGVLLFANKDAD